MISIRRRAAVAVERALDEVMRLAAEPGLTITEQKALALIRDTLVRLVEDRTSAPYRMEGARRIALAKHIRAETHRPSK
jgi:hypothetical protein